MLRLCLLRHAKAAALAGGGDHARPLALRGREDAARVGAWLAAHPAIPDLALVSDARRARETFEFAAAAFAEPVSARLEPRIYNASPGVLLALAQAEPETVHTLMLVGHNPGMAELAQLLAGYGDRYAASRMRAGFPACALAILDFDAGSWSAIRAGAGRLDCYITPAQLGGEDD